MFTTRPTGSALYRNLRAEFIEITPQLAENILGMSEGENFRKASDLRVSILAKDMVEDRWLQDGSTITFRYSESINTAREALLRGICTDGQHRLWGVVKSGVSQVFLVVIGVESIDAKDTGKVRSATTLLTRENVSNSIGTVALIRMVEQWDTEVRGVGLFHGNMSTPEIKEKVLIDRERLEECAARGKWFRAKSGAIITPRIAAFMVYMATRNDCTPAMERFLSMIADGVGLSKTDPEYCMRTQLTESYSGKGKLLPHDQLARMIVAWNKRVRGEPCSVLRWTNFRIDNEGKKKEAPFPEFEWPKKE